MKARFDQIERYGPWRIGWARSEDRPRLQFGQHGLAWRTCQHEQWGYGAAIEIQAEGPHRTRSIRAQASAANLPGHVRWFGGLSFEEDAADGWGDFGPARFFVPRWFWSGESVRAIWREDEPVPEKPRFESSSARVRVSRIHRESADRYQSRVQAALRSLSRGRLRKVVLSRDTHVEGDFEPNALLVALGRDSTSSHELCFAFSFGGATYMGRTPELLVSASGTEVRSEALAGSSSLEEADALLHRPKDRAEHAHVVATVVEGLKRVGISIGWLPEPRVRRLRGIAHLWTPIRVHEDPPVPILDLVDALHPTAATAGLPTGPARVLLRELEGRPRGWYCGAVGWFDGKNDGDFRVALRSALVHPQRLHVSVGGGIVEGSEPRAEWEETLLKERAILAAFGLA
ncbi:MAG: isochorismate synthase MenF [Myxococcota bacterium]